jgi:hypothetical protein
VGGAVKSAQLLPIVRELFSEPQEYLQYLHPKEVRPSTANRTRSVKVSKNV